mmetsp:Transcript_34722/g.63860  ORF Transcript_34722/g.63860 Transcript_34722/m.63860 type:complete len:257 (-) Transcript_34722:921-1691(-)
MLTTNSHHIYFLFVVSHRLSSNYTTLIRPFSILTTNSSTTTCISLFVVSHTLLKSSKILQLIRIQSSRLDNLLPPASLIRSRLRRIVNKIFVKFVIIIIIIIKITPSGFLLLRIFLPIGIFHHKLCPTLLFPFIHVMILHPLLRRLDTSKTDIARGSSSMQRRPRSQSSRVIKTSIITIHVTPPPYNPILVFSTADPLPHIPRHIVQTVGIRFEGFHGTRRSPSILAAILPRKIALSPKIGMLLTRFDRRILAPYV